MPGRQWSGMTGAEFREELRRLNLTQQWFAEQSGLDLSTVAKWCADESIMSGQPIPQYAAFILQLLERLSYRGELRDVSDQVEAFVRMIMSGTLLPPKEDRDASRFAFAGDGVPDHELVPLVKKRQRKRPKRDDWVRPFRVRWIREGGTEERWYSQQPSAYRKVRELRKLGVEATLEHAVVREGV